MNIAYLSLGSNEGDRMLWLQKATKLISDKCGRIIKISSIYETAAWGITDQPDFLNLALELESELSPDELLTRIHSIETKLGRQREIKWGPRTLDIDLLLFNDQIINTPDLAIPHPYLHERLFVLKPLSEVAPQYVHPILHKSIMTLLTECKDQLNIHKYIDSISS